MCIRDSRERAPGFQRRFREIEAHRRRVASIGGHGVMTKYEIIIYWSEEDGAFVAEVPELPGCMADGATYEEALAGVNLVAQEWIETALELGRSVPEPKGRLMFA